MGILNFKKFNENDEFDQEEFDQEFEGDIENDEEVEEAEHRYSNDKHYEILKGVCEDFNVELSEIGFSIEQINEPSKIFQEPLLSIVLNAMALSKNV